MQGGQRRKDDFPYVKGLRTKRTKFGQRYLLVEKDEAGHEHCVTVPIDDNDTNETFMQKVDAARQKLNKRQSKTFDELLEFFFSSRMLSDGSRRLYRFALRGFSLDEDANRVAVQNILTAKIKKTTIAVYLQKVRCFFSWASSHGVAVENPAKDVEVKCAISHRSRVMTDAEIIKVLDYASRASPLYRLFILLLLHTGARVSTIQCIRKDDLTNDGLSLYNVKCRRFYDYKIPVNNPEILDLWQETNAVGPIFGESGRTFTKRLNSWLHSAFGVDAKGETISVHSFRHTFASRAAMHGVPMEVISKLLDHQSVAVTAKFYARFSNEQIADAVAKAVKDFPS